nr:tail fiber domain-containing protein [uncultured Flavobacterium sp.]
MRKWLLLLFLISLQSNAQTGIGTTTPNASAKLDVYATNKGFLPPRVTLTSATDATTIASPAEGLLVYNLGSVGLQAGYYYWNGASWATIATATSAGNGVTSMDLVKLYSKAYSTSVGDIAETNGYSFTVPVSGRYLFDFTSSGYANSATFTMTFKVRQGTTDLGTDAQTSSNNTVHVEYNGKIEVNLQAGTTYNVIVITNGVRNIADYDRVYYKMVAGNLPVTGQTVEYGIAKYTGADGGPLGGGALISFDATAAGNLAWSGNKFTLKANKTYELESSLAIYQSAGGVGGRFQIYDYTNNVALANGLFMSQNGAGTNNPSANSPMKGIVTPTTDIQVGIRMQDWYGSGGPGIIGSTSFTGSQSSPNASYFMVKQIGSSAIVNPWTLSGTNTYNTTGNVGIGTTNPIFSPYSQLTVKSTTEGGIAIQAGATNYSRLFFAKDDVSNTEGLIRYYHSDNSMHFFTAATERMRITSGGNVGIGTATPTRKLHVQTADATSAYIESTAADNNGLMILNANTNQNWAAGWHELLMFQNQGTTIGHITGINASSVSYNTTSDYRLKTDFKNYSGLDLVNKIQTYDYAWKSDSSRMFGVMAHELQAVLPYAVTGKKDAVDANGKIIPQAVDYSKLTPILVKAVQEQDLKLKEQQKQIDALMQRLGQLETKKE